MYVDVDVYLCHFTYIYTYSLFGSYKPMQRHVQLIRELIHPRGPLNFDRHEPKPKTALHPKPLNPKPKPLHKALYPTALWPKP